MKKERSMKNHINHIKTLPEHLETISNSTAEKDLAILWISSLSQEYNYLITTLETVAEDHLTWDNVRERFHKSEKKKSCEAEELIDALFVTNLTKVH